MQRITICRETERIDHKTNFDKLGQNHTMPAIRRIFKVQISRHTRYQVSIKTFSKIQIKITLFNSSILSNWKIFRITDEFSQY